jgi:hypothetical protein
MGRDTQARAALREAADLGRQSRSSRVEVRAVAHLAALAGGSAAEAEQKLAELEPRLPLEARMEARYLLFQANGNRAHLVESHRSLRYLCAHAPAADRDEMVGRVPLYRAIAGAMGAR